SGVMPRATRPSWQNPLAEEIDDPATGLVSRDFLRSELARLETRLVEIETQLGTRIAELETRL
ncbi:MAG TPA: hypothetical protein VE597_01110, partial [Geminicoccaceae bacterium]|nr:hypothetical protein [Geminicoccaceae bacterium]